MYLCPGLLPPLLPSLLSSVYSGSLDHSFSLPRAGMIVYFVLARMDPLCHQLGCPIVDPTMKS